MLHGSHIISLQVKRVSVLFELDPILVGQSVRPLISSSNNGVETLLVLAQRPIALVLMMINSCSYSTNDLVFN